MVLSFFKKSEANKSVLPRRDESELFSVLLKKGLLSPTQYKAIELESERLQKSKREILERTGLVSEDNLALAYSLVYGIPLAHLPDALIPQNILLSIPQKDAVRLQIVPFGAENGYLKIGVVDPFLLSEYQDFLNQVLLQNKMKPAYFIIPKSDFKRVYGQYGGSPVFPMITLKGVNIPYQIITKLPQKIAEEYKMVVFDYVPGALLKIAAVNPYDPKTKEVLDFIERRTGLKVERYQITEGDLQQALTIYHAVPVESSLTKPEETGPTETQEQVQEEVAQEEVTEETEEKPKKTNIKVETITAPQEEFASLLQHDVKDLKELESIIRSGHVPKIVAALINFACQKRATDIHIQPSSKDLLIRYRIDGLLRDIAHIPKDLHPAIISRIKILATLKIDEQRIPQDGRFNTEFHGKEVDIRVSTMPTSFGEKAALRLLDKSFGLLTLEQLGLQGKGFEDLTREIEKPYGVIMATGPTGSGKSTTLYAIINRIKNPTVNIVTLEDPVEYQIEGINQSQIRPEIGYTFATGLRSILRQDPNVIMVGEIRDKETADMTVHAALTGHLVLTTLHTNDAASALPRLINMGIEPFLITSAINAIIAQRLIRRVCQKCQEEAHLSNAVIEEIEKEVEKIPKEILEKLNIKKPYNFRRGRGCDECNNGYKGRIGIYEVLVMSMAIEELAARRRPASEIQEVAQKEGMLTMKQDGILKVLQGITTYDEVLRVIATD